MDLSTGGDIDLIRRSIIDASPVPVGTVPIYEVVAKYGSDDFNGDVIVNTILSQAKQGVDYMTIHPGLLRRHVPIALKRVLGIVSRGGSLIARWMQRYEQENPFYSRFDDILNICLDYDVTLSLGDGLRPGCLADAVLSVQQSARKRDRRQKAIDAPRQCDHTHKADDDHGKQVRQFLKII